LRFFDSDAQHDVCGIAPELDEEDGEPNFVGSRLEIMLAPPGAIRRSL
jgi:hypothetical protein